MSNQLKFSGEEFTVKGLLVAASAALVVGLSGCGSTSGIAGTAAYQYCTPFDVMEQIPYKERGELDKLSTQIKNLVYSNPGVAYVQSSKKRYVIDVDVDAPSPAYDEALTRYLELTTRFVSDSECVHDFDLRRSDSKEDRAVRIVGNVASVQGKVSYQLSVYVREEHVGDFVSSSS